VPICHRYKFCKHENHHSPIVNSPIAQSPKTANFPDGRLAENCQNIQICIDMQKHCKLNNSTIQKYFLHVLSSIHSATMSCGPAICNELHMVGLKMALHQSGRQCLSCHDYFKYFTLQQLYILTRLSSRATICKKYLFTLSQLI